MKLDLGQCVEFERHYTPELVYRGTRDNDIDWGDEEVGIPPPRREDLDRVCWRNDLDAPVTGLVVGEGTIEECFYAEDGLEDCRLVRFVLVREKLRGRAYRVKREDLRPVEDGEGK